MRKALHITLHDERFHAAFHAKDLALIALQSEGLALRVVNSMFGQKGFAFQSLPSPVSSRCWYFCTNYRMSAQLSARNREAGILGRIAEPGMIDRDDRRLDAPFATPDVA